ncbi:MAG: hypothetical protein ACUVS4_04460 [Chloroflexaceae bacterium]
MLLGYLLLGVLFTWPLALHLGDSVIQKGDLPVDAAQGVWNLWWAYSALLVGENPFVTRMLFHPATLNLLYQTLSLPNGLLALPVLLLAGPVAAFNGVVLLSFGLGGYWVYRLARAFTLDRFAALAAGFVFVFTPYHIQRVWSGPLELIAIHWLALYALLLARALARRGPASVASAALALVVTTLASQYYGLYAAVYTVFYVILATLLAPRGARWPTFLSGAGIGALWAALLLPLVIWAGGLGAAVLEDWYMRQVYHSVALVDLVAPNVRHPLWGGPAETWLSQRHPFGSEGGAGVGLGVALLIGVALWRGRGQAWPWALLALLLLLLAMGPQLRLTAAASPVPGPFLLLDLFAPFRNSSRPAIFVAIMLIPVAVMVALGMAALRLPTTDCRAMGPVRWAPILAALVVSESLVAPWPLMRLRAAPQSLALNADPTPGAVLDLPPRLNDSMGLLNQICHGRPIMGGYLARIPFYPIVAASSATRRLWLAAEPLPDIVPLDPAAELASLGTRFVVLDLTQLPRVDQRRLREQLAVPGISRFSASDSREIYAVDPAAARPVALLGAGWYEAEREGGRRWRWMGEEAEVLLLARERSVVILSWRATAYGAPRPLGVRLGDDRRLIEVGVPAAPYDRTVVLHLILPPGQTTLTLESLAENVADGRRLSLSLSEMRLTTLPVSPAWVATAPLDIPPTRPAISTPPCQ